MRSFWPVLERLRTLVETKDWDYCILWKSRDDSCRFVDWADCCCSGGKNADADDENLGAEGNLAAVCLDTRFRHYRRTKACQALAQFPSSIPLNSGIHGDVLISNKPLWLTSDDVSPSDSSLVGSSQYLNSFEESTGTRVLIPISAGIVELFGTKQIPRDTDIIDFVIAHCNLQLEQVAKSEVDVSLNAQSLHSFPKYYSLNWADPQPSVNFKSTSQILPPVSKSTSFPICEGSSSGPKSSYEHPYFDSYSYFISHELFNQPTGRYYGYGKPLSHEDTPKQQKSSASEYSNILQKDEAKTRGRQQKEKYQSKNLITERKRRNRIRDRLYALRALVPNISKMDRASIIVDAIDYIRELEENVKILQNELIHLEHEDWQNNIHLKISPSERIKDEEGYPSLVQRDQPTVISGEEKPMEVQVEVVQINERDFLIKLFCKKIQGGIMRLIEAIDSLGLQVVDVNVTTFESKVLNILHVEANKNDIQPLKLRDSLIKLTSRQISRLKQALQREKACEPDSVF